jgi:hypothetical protein
VVFFGDCESAPLVSGLAESDSEPYVRMRALQELFNLAAAAKAPCPDAVPPARIQALFAAALKSSDKVVRMGALTDLEKHQPAWRGELRPLLFEILDGQGPGEERRLALGALGTAKDDMLKERLPRYFHDPSPQVRSTAVSTSRVFAEAPTDPSGFEGCLIGVVRWETENNEAFRMALELLQRTARDWIGLPPDVRLAAGHRNKAWEAFRAEIFTRGESRGVDREAWAREWFRWHAERLALSPDEVTAAVQAWDRFGAAKRSGDGAAARAALEGFPRKVPGLFCHEEGWLAVRGSAAP